MKQAPENYTCPYCRWSKSHVPANVREEEDLLSRKYLDSDIENTYWLETKKKFKVNICRKCERNLKVRSRILWSLLTCMLCGVGLGVIGIVLEKVITEPWIDTASQYAVAIGLAAGAILVLFRLLWKFFGPSRPHVDFKRASECNALAPLYTAEELAERARLMELFDSSKKES